MTGDYDREVNAVAGSPAACGVSVGPPAEFGVAEVAEVGRLLGVGRWLASGGAVTVVVAEDGIAVGVAEAAGTVAEAGFISTGVGGCDVGDGRTGMVRSAPCRCTGAGAWDATG